MAKTLQQIKDEYAYKQGRGNWDDFQEYYIYWDNDKLKEGINQIAIRYAQEQNKELVDMLSILNKTFKSACGLHPITLEVDELIKSATEI